MRMIIYLQTSLLILLPVFTIAQTQIDREISFLHFLKVNNKDFNEGSYPFGDGNLSCFWYYSSEFDKYNYASIKNDEFKRNNYTNQLSKTLKTKVDALTFKKEYSLISQSSFGDFNFADNSFPITKIFSDCHFLKDKTELNHDCYFTTVPITIGWIINRDYFDYKIKLSPDKAENLINTRKQSNGKIDRTIQTRIIFTFVNQPWYFPGKEFPYNNILEKDGFIIYITRIEFYDNGQLIASLKPNTIFEDSISGYKKLNGEDIYHMVTKDYKNILSDNTIVVNRVNGVPVGPVKYYDVNGNLIRLINCSYFFPNRFTISGEDAKFVKKGNKTVPYSITQYSDNHLEGYIIFFAVSKSGDHSYDTIVNVTLNNVKKIDKAGTETILLSLGFMNNHTPYGTKIKDMPKDVQNLIMKYDYDNYFLYSNNGATTSPTINKNEEIKISDIDKATTSDLDKINPISILTGTESKIYLSGNTDIYTNKKTGAKEKSNFLFLFNYKDGKNDNIKPEVKDYIIKQFQNWVKESINAVPISLDNLNESSLFKVELIFTVRLFAIKSLDAYIDTRVYIVKNGELILDESFKNSKSLFMESNEPYTVLDNVIKNCEKKIVKILGEYLYIK